MLKSRTKILLRPGPYITPEDFENEGFTLKTHQMLFVQITLEEFTNITMTGHVGFV